MTQKKIVPVLVKHFEPFNQRFSSSIIERIFSLKLQCLKLIAKRQIESV